MSKLARSFNHFPLHVRLPSISWQYVYLIVQKSYPASKHCSCRRESGSHSTHNVEYMFLFLFMFLVSERTEKAWEMKMGRVI
jgi:hypothetical protein